MHGWGWAGHLPQLAGGHSTVLDFAQVGNLSYQEGLHL